MQTKPRQLMIIKPNNIRGSTHGEITAYQDIWKLAEKQRHSLFIDENWHPRYGLAYNNATRIQSHVIIKLKELNCTNIRFCEEIIKSYE